MKKYIVSLFFVLLFSLSLPAQDNNSFYHSHSRIFFEFNYHYAWSFAYSCLLGSHTGFDGDWHLNSLQFIGGYFIVPRLSVGGGIGMEGLSGSPTLPVLIDVKGYLHEKPHTPFAFVTIGKSFHSGDFHQSFKCDIGIGYNLSFTKIALHTTVSYVYKRISDMVFYDSGNPLFYTEKKIIPFNFHSISLGVGILF